MWKREMDTVFERSIADRPVIHLVWKNMFSRTSRTGLAWCLDGWWLNDQPFKMISVNMPERSKLPTLKTNQALPDFHDHSLACVFNHLHILYGYRLNFCFFEWWKKGRGFPTKEDNQGEEISWWMVEWFRSKNLDVYPSLIFHTTDRH